jgi:adenylate cyclase
MLRISVKNDKQNKEINHSAGPIEFGRGVAQGSLPRFVVEDGFVSRDQLRVEELPGDRAHLRNLSTKYPITLGDGTEIPANGDKDLNLPVRLRIGETLIEIAPNEAATASPAGIPTVTGGRPNMAPTRPPVPPTMPEVSREAIAADGYQAIQPVRPGEGSGALALPSLGEAPSLETLTQWMETVLALQRSDASPAEFYGQTAHALVRMVGLDVGLVLTYGEKGWKVVARAAADDDDSNAPAITGREFSQTVLRHVLAEKQTFFQDLGQMKQQESLRSVDAVVVSPVFGLHEEVAGALYGLRRPSAKVKGCKIQPLEAQLVQLLAAAVGANLARTTATRTRTQFEQFFSTELVRELERDPGLLEGRGKEVTILMSDLRGFSTLSERLGPQETCRLVRDVMERLSERIVEHGGVIVSYLGDGILAMWNAPAKQEDHAVRACRAALAMLEELPGLNATWERIVGHPLCIGIGVNTGPAQVGNTGSSRKFMYGPLGNTVNLASRVEGATKHLKVPILLTGSTRQQLGNAFVTRRLCQVRVVGIHHAVDLFELRNQAPPEWIAYRDTYEAALTMYEARQWLKTCQILLPLLERSQVTGEFDHATLKLMKRSWSCLETPPEQFDPVMELTTK